MLKNLTRLVCGFVVVTHALPAPAHEESGDFFHEVVSLRSDLTAAAEAMGQRPAVPRCVPLRCRISDATPRHALDQVRLAYTKLDRIARQLEIDGFRPQIGTPESHFDEALSHAIEQTRARVDEVMAALGIVRASAPPAHNANPSNDNLVLETLAINELLNRMLTQRRSAESSYRQVELTLSYVRGIKRARSREVSEQPPQTKESAHDSTWGDAYLALLRCFPQIRRVAGDAATILNIEVDPAELNSQTTSSDVYDLASTLAAEATHVAWRLNARPDAPPETWSTGTRFLPFHVVRAADLVRLKAEGITNNR